MPWGTDCNFTIVQQQRLLGWNALEDILKKKKSSEGEQLLEVPKAFCTESTASAKSEWKVKT